MYGSTQARKGLWIQTLIIDACNRHLQYTGMWRWGQHATCIILF